jgi:fructose transport system permease protein
VIDYAKGDVTVALCISRIAQTIQRIARGDTAAMTDNAAPTKTISDFEAKLNEADKTVASFARDDKTLVHKARAFLRSYPTTIPALVLILSVIVFGIIAPRFLSTGALSTVLQQVTVTGIVAIAQTLVILTAGIDLSVGAILVVASLVMGNLAVNLGVPVPLAIAAGMAIGAVMGWINGALVAFIKLPPFIVTLGTLSVFTALKLWYSHSESIRNVDITEKAPALLWFGESFKTLGAKLTYGSISLIVLAVIIWYILNHTAWGRHVHAIGDDPDAAMLSGIRTNRILVSVYALAGLICGFAAWVAIGRVGSVSPVSFDTINLGSITAVVIGGTSLFGGRGSIVGSVLGALIVGVFNTGLSLAGVDDYWQMFAAGNLVIIAVALDQWLRRASQ